MESFFRSSTFITHVTGLLGLVGVNMVVPNSTALSVAVAVITGIAQAAHAYKEVRMQPTLTAASLGSVLTNAAGTQAIEAHTEGPVS